MKKLMMLFLMLLTSSFVSAQVIIDSGVYGKVGCDDGMECHYIYAGGVLFPGVLINIESTDGSYSSSMLSDDQGTYKLPVEPGIYTVSIDLSTIPVDAVLQHPSAGSYMVEVVSGMKERRDFILNAPVCGTEGTCWMTAGGVKFENLMDIDAAQSGPKDSFGGNVNPSCSPEPGDGGNWNHISHSLKLHFKGTSIRVVRCGNVTGIDPGSESPVTPFNFIEFEGTGTLDGIKGNKFPKTDVSFFARVEDHNEPGNDNAADGKDVDRYFLRVFEGGGAGTTHLLVDEDGDPSTVDPLSITGGNLQLHFSSCED